MDYNYTVNFNDLEEGLCKLSNMVKAGYLKHTCTLHK